MRESVKESIESVVPATELTSRNERKESVVTAATELTVNYTGRAATEFVS